MDDTLVFHRKAVDNPKAPIRVLHRNMLHPARSVREDEDQSMEDKVALALSKANALMEAYFDV